MQYKDSRQDVTGLVVNSKVNTRAECRRSARLMVYRLLKTGSFQKKLSKFDDSGNLVVIEEVGTLDELNGMLSFIDSVSTFNKKKIKKNMTKAGMTKVDLKEVLNVFNNLSSNERIYRNFLLYRYFYSNPSPLIICEGPTDPIYIKAAIRQLADTYPKLIKKKKEGGVSLEISFFSRTPTTERILGLAGGASEFIDFMK